MSAARRHARAARSPARRRCAQSGATLIEIVLFIVIIGIAVGTVLGTLSLTAGRSADPLVRRQALAIAESLLQEIEAQPFGSTDPDGGADALGPEAGESRGSSTNPFDHVNDYHGYTTTGIVDADGALVTGLSAYNVAVAVQPQALDNIAASDGLLVSVTVTSPGGASVTLTGFRARNTP